MKIIVLDGYTLNPGDLDWAPLRRLGACDIHDRTSAADVLPRSAGAEILLTNKTVLDRAAIESLPALRYIGVLATGYNVVDVPAARRRGVCVTNVPAYATPSVAQFTFALLLELCHHVGHHSATVRQGRWSASEHFCYWDSPLVELDGLTLGVVGLGNIGRAVARLAVAFGMKVLAATAHPPQSPPDGVVLAPLDDLFRRADVVSLHCPLNDQTRHLVNAQRLAAMKPSAFLINTSRGPLVHEGDLAAALNAGRIAGAALDVLSVEPPPADNPLLAADNCIITPHIAWAARSARQRLLAAAVANLQAFLHGHPQNIVNP